MKINTLSKLLLIGAFGVLTGTASAKPAVHDLAGKWNTVIEFGKFKFKMDLKIASAEGKKIQATLDIPDQGAKDVPVSALLFNSPAVRLEIDQFGTAFNGEVSEDSNSISGEFEEGPGGRPIQVVFKRNTQPDKPEPVKLYTFAAGEAMDMRGYWKTAFEPMPGMSLRLGLRIGKLPDGSFHALLDSFDQGMEGFPATSAGFTNGTAKLEWQLMRAEFEGKLDADGKVLEGQWKQGPRGLPVKFERLAKPATAMPEGLSFVPDKNSPEDFRGHWKGAIEVEGRKLRLAFKFGKLPDGTFAGTMLSLDQGGREIPATTLGYTNPVVRAEWKGLRGIYTGTLNKEGTEFTGTWDQWGRPSPLKLTRVESAEAAAKP